MDSDHNVDADRAKFTRRGAIWSLLLPAAAIAGGCAGTGGRTEARGNSRSGSTTSYTYPDAAFDPRPGASIMNPDGTRSFRNHELFDQDGRRLRFQDDLITGQIFAATFFYVHCKGICSDMTTAMTGAYDLLQPAMGNPIRFYTFSLAEDSPDDLKEYMQARGLYGRPGWSFLTAPKPVIKDIRWAFGFSDPDEEIDSNLNGHTGMARFGNHRLDKWSSCPALGTPLSIARSTMSILPPNERPYIAALERDPASRGRKLPNYTPKPPSMQSGPASDERPSL